MSWKDVRFVAWAFNRISGEPERVDKTNDSRNALKVESQYESDRFRHMMTAEYTPLVERKPLPGLSDIRDIVEGTGTASVVNGEIQLDGSTNKVSLYTADRGRYLPGLMGLAGIGVRIPVMGSGHYEWGYGDSFGNRIGMELNAGDLFTVVESGGTRYFRNARANWLDPLDGTGPSGLTLDLSRHILRLRIGWYGYLSVEYVAVIPDRDLGDPMVVFDRSEQPSGAIMIQEPDLPIFAEADGGVLFVGGRQYGAYGRYNPEFRVTSSPNVQKASVGTDFEPIVSFRVKSAAQWRGVRLALRSAGVMAADNAEWAIFIDPALTGASFGAVSGVDASETALEVDSDATALSGGYKAYGDNIAGGQGNTSGGVTAQLPDVTFPTQAVVTLAARALTGTTTINAVFRMQEQW